MSAAIVNKFMRMMGIGDNDEDNEYDDEVDCYDEEEQDEVENREVPKARRSFRDIESSNPYSKNNNQTKVIPMNTAVSSSKMVITQPTCYADVEEIGEYLKLRKSVIINLENVGKEDAIRILDFLGGATFMVEGTIQKVSNLIYLLTPKDVEIQNDVEKSQYKQKMSFSWLK